MAIKGIIFDLYGTLIDIETDEADYHIYRSIAHFLTYRGIYIHRKEVKENYYRIMKRQKEKKNEKYPEIDVICIWDTFLAQYSMEDSHERKELARILAQMYRGISRKRLRLYPYVKEVLNELRDDFQMAIVSDAQSCYAIPEICALGLDEYFNPVIISSEYGYRKPDMRLIQKALVSMKLETDEVIFAGNDMYRDIYGAKRLAIKTIFFNSNQGNRSCDKAVPDYTILEFKEILDCLTGES